MGLTTQALSEANWSDFEALLAPANGCDGCWCYNHHIQPGDPDVTGDEARLAKRALAVAGKALGVLAYDDGEPAGWCAVDLPDDIPGHDCVEPGAAPAHRWSVHCFYVRPESRGRGVSRALLEAAEALARSRGLPDPPRRGDLRLQRPLVPLRAARIRGLRRRGPLVLPRGPELA